ncbi:Calx-beta domain-containing protein, partial [Thioalkalivibrio sp. HK1]|uniref:Calx-beta domain-containing protein n=1 Tax=Thioalkalivibrio sp. HK1 TaxID=1469245 RepID=UPI001E6410C5
MTFSSANWNIEQTVTVTATDDDGDGGENDNATLQLRGTDNATQYQADVRITIDDDDDTPAFILSRNALTILEGDSAGASFNVALATAPSSDVTVTLAPGGTNSSNLTLSATSQTFTTSNWSTAQPITVTVNGDLSSNGSATVGLTASGGGYASATGSVTVSLINDDVDGLMMTPVSLSVDEGGSGTLMVRLAKAPTVSVTVTLAQPSNTDVKVDTDLNAAGNQNTLTFTANDFASPQAVTVSAAEDDDAAQGTATIDLTAVGGTYASATGSVTVTVNDNDTAELTISSKNLSLAEDDTATFTVRLASEPSASVTVNLAQSVTANTDVTFNPSTLTFTASDWETTQTVTVTAAEDDTDRVPDTATISLTAAGGDYASVTGSVSVSVADDDITIVTTPVTTPSSPLTAREGGTGTNLGVALSHQPSHNIYIRSDITEGSSSDVTRVPGDEFLVFTPDNWNVNQNIGITVAEDPDAVDEGPSSIELMASGFGYDITNLTVDIDARDDDPPDLTLSPGSLTINEGETATFEIELARTTPLGSGEELEIFVLHPLGISVDTDERTSGNQNKLIFTSSNWNQPQTIEVSASSDEDEDDETATISFRFAGTANYEGTSKTTMSVAITDSGTQSVILSDTTLQVVEGGESKEITVRLTSPPSNNVTVTLAQPSIADIRVDTNPGRAGNQNTLT